MEESVGLRDQAQEQGPIRIVLERHWGHLDRGLCGLCWREPREMYGRLIALHPHVREELNVCRDCCLAVERLFSVVGDQLCLVSHTHPGPAA